MTWRAFIIGLLGVVGLCFFTPINDYRLGNTFLTGNHFPAGVYSLLFVLIFLVNVPLKLVRRAWALKQGELMLICCMMLVSSTVPASGLMRYWFPMTAAAPYLAQRPDVLWEDDILKVAPEGLVLSKDPKSAAARKFYQGTPKGEDVHVPWGAWTKVFVTWGAFIGFYYMAIMFLCGMLRKHWVENERLIFALPRVPLELTEGADGPGLLPPLVCRPAFLYGVGASLIFGLMRLSPLFFGAEEAWKPIVPIGTILTDTSLRNMGMSNGPVYPICIAFAYLVPSDVSLSIWLTYIVMSLEVQAVWAFGRPFQSGVWGPFIRWQRSGAVIVFALGMIWGARRHLAEVARKALGRGGPDDSEEPIGYRLGFWGFLVCAAGVVGWFMWFSMSLWAALLLVFLLLAMALVHARLIAQGGLYFTGSGLHPPNLLHSASGGHAFSGPAAIAAQMQFEIFHDAREWLSPHVMNALRLSAVMKRRRLLLPAMVAALAVGVVAAGYSTLRYVHYDIGTVNSFDALHSGLRVPMRAYQTSYRIINSPGQSAEPHFGALAIGATVMTALMVLRRSFYWWPVHPIGFALSSPWPLMELWFCFMLGWLAKRVILKFGTGGMLRGARTFFLGVICTETTMVGLTTLYSLVSGVRIGQVFLSG